MLYWKKCGISAVFRRCAPEALTEEVCEMTFSEKLIFLMRTTSTSNKQLAEAISVDPSLISLFRTARRGMPKNHTHIKAMAAYFAKKTEGNYQRTALAEAMGRKYLPSQMDTAQIGAVLFDWLSDSRDQVSNFLVTVERFAFEDSTEPSTVPTEVKNYGNKGFVYYGNAGRRAAMNDFFDYIISTGKKGVVYFTTDENMNWLFEEHNFFHQLRSRVIAALNNGYRICRIAAPIRTLDNAIESFTSFLPLYLTGQMESFYYPNLRDGLYHRTLIVFPGVASVVSTTVGGQQTCGATVLTHEARFTASLEEEFKAYLSLCKPMMTMHSSALSISDLLRSMSQFASDKGNRIQQSASLSFITAPVELLKTAATRAPAEHRSAVYETHIRVRELFRSSLEEYETIDIHSIATAEEVRAGVVPVASPFFNTANPFCYTPENYVLHLKNILSLMETYKNYHAVLVPFGPDSHSLMVKEGRHMILPCPGEPTKTFEIMQPYIAEACRAYLMQICNFSPSSAVQQLDTISQIRALIRELGGKP